MEVVSYVKMTRCLLLKYLLLWARTACDRCACQGGPGRADRRDGNLAGRRAQRRWVGQLVADDLAVARDEDLLGTGDAAGRATARVGGNDFDTKQNRN